MSQTVSLSQTVPLSQIVSRLRCESRTPKQRDIGMACFGVRYTSGIRMGTTVRIGGKTKRKGVPWPCNGISLPYSLS